MQLNMFFMLMQSIALTPKTPAVVIAASCRVLWRAISHIAAPVLMRAGQAPQLHPWALRSVCSAHLSSGIVNAHPASTMRNSSGLCLLQLISVCGDCLVISVTCFRFFSPAALACCDGVIAYPLSFFFIVKIVLFQNPPELVA